MFGRAEVITLNVGGEIFTTTKDTILKSPETMLNKMFSGNWKVQSTYFSLIVVAYTR